MAFLIQADQVEQRTRVVVTTTPSVQTTVVTPSATATSELNNTSTDAPTISTTTFNSEETTNATSSIADLTSPDIHISTTLDVTSSSPSLDVNSTSFLISTTLEASTSTAANTTLVMIDESSTSTAASTNITVSSQTSASTIPPNESTVDSSTSSTVGSTVGSTAPATTDVIETTTSPSLITKTPVGPIVEPTGFTQSTTPEPVTETYYEEHTVGNKIDTDKDLHRLGPSSSTFILPKVQFKKGVVHTIRAALYTTSPIKLQIWRPSEDGKMLLVHSVEYKASVVPAIYEIPTVKGSGVPVRYKEFGSDEWVSLSTQRRRRRQAPTGIPVEEGDVLGFQVDGGNPLPFAASDGLGTNDGVFMIDGVDSKVTPHGEPITSMAFLIQADQVEEKTRVAVPTTPALPMTAGTAAVTTISETTAIPTDAPNINTTISNEKTVNVTSSIADVSSPDIYNSTTPDVTSASSSLVNSTSFLGSTALTLEASSTAAANTTFVVVDESSTPTATTTPTTDVSLKSSSSTTASVSLSTETSVESTTAGSTASLTTYDAKPTTTTPLLASTTPVGPIVEPTVVVTTTSSTPEPVTETYYEERTVGNSMDTNQRLHRLGKSTSTFILPKVQFEKGIVHTIRVALYNDSPIKLQIWRPSEDGRMLLVHSVEYKASVVPAIYEIPTDEGSGVPVRYQKFGSDEWISVRAKRRVRRQAPNGIPVNDGDVLGFQVDGIHPLPFATSDGSGSNDGVFMIDGLGSEVTPQGSPVTSMAFLIQADQVEEKTRTVTLPMTSDIAVTSTTFGIGMTTESQLTTADTARTSLPSDETSTPNPTSLPYESSLFGYAVTLDGYELLLANKTFILDDFTLDAGYLYRFYTYLSIPEPVYLNIWRPLPNERFKLVHEQVFTPEVKGFYHIYPTSPVLVEQGDLLGLRGDARNPVLYHLSPGGSVSCSDYFSSPPREGDVVPRTGMLYDVVFGLEVEITSQPVDDPPEPVYAETVGNAWDGSGQRGRDGNYTYILQNAKLVDGFVHWFNVYLLDSSSVRLQIWRPAGGTRYRLVGEVLHRAQYGDRMYRIYPPLDAALPVQEGDLLGFTVQTINPVPFTLVDRAPVVISTYGRAPPEVGDTVQKSGDTSRYKYHINAVVGPTYMAPPTGPPGPLGSPGPQGAPGERGDTGPGGVEGEQGMPGETGDPGPSGQPGIPGVSGPPGQPGDVGPAVPGPRGRNGTQGAMGDFGAPGPRGDRGEDGLQGVSGEVGEPGEKGDRGEAGPRGEPGRSGREGEPGPVGPTGAPGLPGSPGPIRNRPSCSDDNGGCDQLCVDRWGRLECRCEPGFKLQRDGKSCLDVDECLVDNGDCQHYCTHTGGLPTCSCRPGFVLSNSTIHCNDVDECRLLKDPCLPNELCLNSEGSFLCFHKITRHIRDGHDMNAAFANQPPHQSTIQTSPGRLAGRTTVIVLIIWLSLLTVLLILVAGRLAFSDEFEDDDLVSCTGTGELSMMSRYPRLAGLDTLHSQQSMTLPREHQQQLAEFVEISQPGTREK